MPDDLETRIAEALTAIAEGDYEAMVRIGGPVEHRADTYAAAGHFELEGHYETDARYVYPARGKAIRQCARAALSPPASDEG